MPHYQMTHGRDIQSFCNSLFICSMIGLCQVASTFSPESAFENLRAPVFRLKASCLVPVEMSPLKLMTLNRKFGAHS